MDSQVFEALGRGGFLDRVLNECAGVSAGFGREALQPVFAEGEALGLEEEVEALEENDLRGFSGFEGVASAFGQVEERAGVGQVRGVADEERGVVGGVEE